jgi:hypothetical protein
LPGKPDSGLIRVNNAGRGFPKLEAKESPMIGITLTTDQIRKAPPQVRQWIEHEVIASLGLAADAPPAAEPNQGAHLVGCNPEDAAAVLAQIQGLVPAFNVFFEFARPGISYGQPPVMAFRLIDILFHTQLQSIDQVVECLEAINEAFARVRHDPSARFCGFDNQGHCLIAPETQRSVAALWKGIIAGQQGAGAGKPNTATAA